MLDGWTLTAFADIAEFRNGLNFVRGEHGHTVKVVGVGDFQQHETLADFSDTASVTISNGIAEIDLLRDNDLLFVRSNGNKALVGRCVLISGVGEPVTFSGFTIRARVRSSSVDHSYLSKLVRSPLFLKHLYRRGGGSSISNLSQDALAEFTFGLPPLPEQRKIAAILRTWDEALEKLRDLRDAKLKIRNAHLQRVLNNENWPEVKIGQLGAISSAGVDKKSIKNQEAVRLLNFVDVLRRDCLHDAEFDHWVTAPQQKISNCDVRKGDVFFTPSSETRDDIAHSAVAMETMPGVVYSYHVVRLRPTAEIDLPFRAYLFKSNHFLRQAYALAAGSGQRYVLSQDQFREMTVRLPDTGTQHKVAAFFSAADKEIDLIDQQIDAISNQKRGLMQKLLTGEWRVEVSGQDEAAA